ADGTFLRVTPESAGWTYVGFEVLDLRPHLTAGRKTGQAEVCVVVISGSVEVLSQHGEFVLGGRPGPWAGPPDAAYLPPGSEFTLAGEGEIALCWAPAHRGGAKARVLPG